MENTRKLIGKISQSEAEYIEPVVERLNSLEELRMIVRDEELQAIVRNEISSLKERCDTWWIKMRSRYKWDSSPDTEWELDSKTLCVWSCS